MSTKKQERRAGLTKFSATLKKGTFGILYMKKILYNPQIVDLFCKNWILNKQITLCLKKICLFLGLTKNNLIKKRFQYQNTLSLIKYVFVTGYFVLKYKFLKGLFFISRFSFAYLKKISNLRIILLISGAIFTVCECFNCESFSAPI